MSLEIVTYANKSQGMFEELVKNEFGVPVKVLGWGKKWNGYSDKSKGLLEYMKTKNDEDIIVFVDGFDSKINKPITDVVKIFKEYNCRVLFSNNPPWFFQSLIFGVCDDSIANAGMYMGYTKELRQILQSEADLQCEDDQVNLNGLCRKYNFVKVDKDEKIFKNFSPIQKIKTSDAIFVSFPGTLGINRYWRGLFEYTQFVYIYVLCLLVLGMAFFPQKQRILVTTLVLYTAFYALAADKSCTTLQV
jgi:hypothetical protein